MNKLFAAAFCLIYNFTMLNKLKIFIIILFSIISILILLLLREKGVEWNQNYPEPKILSEVETDVSWTKEPLSILFVHQEALHQINLPEGNKDTILNQANRFFICRAKGLGHLERSCLKDFFIVGIVFLHNIVYISSSFFSINFSKYEGKSVSFFEQKIKFCPQDIYFSCPGVFYVSKSVPAESGSGAGTAGDNAGLWAGPRSSRTRGNGRVKCCL